MPWDPSLHLVRMHRTCAEPTRPRRAALEDARAACKSAGHADRSNVGRWPPGVTRERTEAATGFEVRAGPRRHRGATESRPVSRSVHPRVPDRAHRSYSRAMVATRNSTTRPRGSASAICCCPESGWSRIAGARPSIGASASPAPACRGSLPDVSEAALRRLAERHRSRSTRSWMPSCRGSGPAHDPRWRRRVDRRRQVVASFGSRSPAPGPPEMKPRNDLLDAQPSPR